MLILLNNKQVCENCNLSQYKINSIKKRPHRQSYEGEIFKFLLSYLVGLQERIEDAGATNIQKPFLDTITAIVSPIQITRIDNGAIEA